MPVRTRSMRLRSPSPEPKVALPKVALPYEKIYNRRKKCWSVRRKIKPKRKKNEKGKRTRKVFSKCTTKEKAVRQMNLLAAIMYNPNFRRR